MVAIGTAYKSGWLEARLHTVRSLKEFAEKVEQSAKDNPDGHDGNPILGELMKKLIDCPEPKWYKAFQLNVDEEKKQK